MPEFTPDIYTQYALEDLYNKNQLLPRLRQEFLIEEIEAHCKDNEIPVMFAADLMSQMVLHKRASVETLVGILHPHFMLGEGIPTTEELQACADMLLKAAEADLVDWDEMAQQFIITVEVSADVYEAIERYQYPLPLVVAPKTVKTNQDTGYHSQAAKHGSLILRAGNHHDGDICLDHINRVNRTRLTINPDTVALVANQWQHLDHQKEGETRDEYRKRVKAFEKYDRVSRDVIASLMAMGNSFYLTHRYDKRGRCYAQGYHVNPQGNDWNKAVIEFADKEIASGMNQKKNQRKDAA